MQSDRLIELLEAAANARKTSAFITAAKEVIDYIHESDDMLLKAITGLCLEAGKIWGKTECMKQISRKGEN